MSFALDQTESINWKHQTPSSSVPSAMQSPCPCSVSPLAKHFRKPHSPFPPTPDWIRAKLQKWGCLSPCQTLLTNLGVKAAVTGNDRKFNVKLISWKGPSKSLVLCSLISRWVNSHHPQYYTCWTLCRVWFPGPAHASQSPETKDEAFLLGIFFPHWKGIWLNGISLQSQNCFFAYNASEMPPSLLQFFFFFFPEKCISVLGDFLNALIESGRGNQTLTSHAKQNEREKEGDKWVFLQDCQAFQLPWQYVSMEAKFEACCCHWSGPRKIISFEN